MASKPMAADKVDGRNARAARTREAIVEAMLTLIEAGDMQPTAGRVAKEAGISERLIYHHFDDLEALLGAVADRQSGRILERLVPISADLPLGKRIDLLVAQRGDILEWISPMRRAALLQEPYSPTLRAHRDHTNVASRTQIAVLFALELAGLSAGERRETVAALDAALSWGAWEHLRAQGLSVAAARRTVHRAVRALLPAG